MTIYTTILVAFLFLSSSILLLFRLRSLLGLAPLYMLLGAAQCLLAFSSSNLNFELWGKHTLFPESMLVFPTVLFTVLLIYITEGVKRSRAIIIGVFVFNFLLLVWFGITYRNESFLGVIAAHSSKAFFILDYKNFITNTILLLFESVLLIIVYQFLIYKIKKNYFFLILFIALASVLVFDAFVFNILLKYDTPDFRTSLTGHLIGGTLTALVFSIVLYSYIKYIGVENKNRGFSANQNRDVFSILKYSAKNKTLKVEKVPVGKKTESQLESTLNTISDGFIALDTHWCYTFVNKKAGDFFGKTPSQLLGKHIWTEFPQGVGLAFYEVCNKAIETQKTQRLEEYVEPFDKWYENRIYPSKEGVAIYFKDITEQKKAELALRESENQLRTLLESEPVCIKQLSDKAELISINPLGLEMIEADSIEEVKGKSVLKLIVPAHHENFKKLLSDVFKGNTEHLVFEIKGLKGTKRWLETHAVPLKDNKGTIISLLGVTRDITSRKKVADQLIKNEKLFRHLSSNVPVGIFQTDKVGSCNYVNEEWVKYAGIPSIEAMGFGWSKVIHPEDKERTLQEWQQAVRDGKEFVSEYRFQKENNQVTWLSVKAVGTYDAQNNLYGYIGMALDITEQKQAEKLLKENKAYLKNIINNIGDPLFVKDEHSRLLLVNDVFCDIFNLKREAVIGKTLAENVSPEEREVFLRIDKKVLSTGIENVNEETLTLKGKEKQIISTKKTRFIDESGNKFLIGIIRDVTTRKKVETELENYRTKLEELVKIRTEEVNLKNEELQRMNKLFVGRELKMKELKTIIKEMQLKNED